MTLYDFLALSDNDRQTILWKDGTFLANYKTGFTCFSLYFIDGFFVEVETVDFNEGTSIKSITAFNQGERLNPYLEFIDLQRLFD